MPNVIEPHLAAVALHALSQPRRLDLFRALLEAGPAGIPLAVLRERFGPNATLSTHLKVLRRAALVRDSAPGNALQIHADFARLEQVLGYLTVHCRSAVVAA